MTVIVWVAGESFPVSHVVATALAQARSRSEAHDGRLPSPAEVGAAVLIAPDALATRALCATGMDPDGLIQALRSAPHDEGSAHDRDRLLVTLLRRADQQRRRMDDLVLGSVHLTLALAESDEPSLTALRTAGVDARLLRTGVARVAVDAALTDDSAFHAQPAPPVFATPPLPDLADLAVRSSAPGSAALKQFLDAQLVSGRNAFGSPYAQVRANRWALVSLLHQLMVIGILLIAIRWGAPWYAFPLILAGSTLTTTTPFWVTVIFIGLAAVFLPIGLFAPLLMTALVSAVKCRYQLSIKRVDSGNPYLAMRQLRAQARSTVTSLLMRRWGIDDDK
ncbi:hypothetical protein AB0J68_17490 [Micromonospora sp. NPDC049580]|uniref:hypothetical protein n=1 Tax=Micromonospora sp. NPDC049580 TaxID=3154832 RepID=UPI00342BE7E6